MNAGFTTIAECCLVSNNSTCSIDFYEKAAELFRGTDNLEPLLNIVIGMCLFHKHIVLFAVMFDLLHVRE